MFLWRPEEKYPIELDPIILCVPFNRIIEEFEPRHDKTNKVSVRPAKTQISLGICRLIRVFAVCMKKPWVLSYPLSAQRRLIRLGGCPGWSESSLGAQPHCWFCHVAAHLCKWAADSDAWGEACRIIWLDQSFRCVLYGSLRTQGLFMRTVKTDQTGLMHRLIFFFWFRFYGPSRLFHTFWTESIVWWGKNGRSSRKTTWPPGSRTWLVSRDLT